MGWSSVPISQTCAATPACNLVSNGWNSMVSFGNDAYQYTVTYLDDLIASVNPADIDIPVADLDINLPTVSLTPPTFGNAPDAPTDLDPTFPDAPAAPVLSPVSALNPGDVPEFLAQYPTINIPAAPTPITDEAPDDAPAFTTPTLPAAPDTSLPDVPTLRSLNIPDAPSLALPTFDAVEPDAPGDTFNPTINFSESLYDSTLLQAVQAEFLDTLQNGDGGLPEAVVDQMWEREREREILEHNRAKSAAVDEFAARGFELPPGALAERLRQAERDSVMKNVSIGREKTIEQAQRAYDYYKFVLQNTVSLEGQLMNYTNSLYQRQLQVQTALLDSGVAVYNAQISAYSAQVQAFNVYADVFKTRIDAELSKIEVFRAQIEGQRAIGELNVQDIEIYKTAVDSVQTIADVYRTEMQAAQVESEIQKVSLEAFKARIDAYSAKVEAKATEYEGYAQQINGELAKVRLYEGSANAYSSEVQGYQAAVQAEAARVRADTDVNEARVREYQGRVDAFRALVQAESAKVQTKVAGYGAEVQAFEAEIRGQVALTEAERSNLEAEVRVSELNADLRLKEAEVNIQRAQQLLNLYNDALKAGATASAQLTASALDAVNLGASISGSDITNN